MTHKKGFLLDTQIFIWWMENNKKLSKNPREILSNPQNRIFLSAASIWEIIIKKEKGKLRFSKNIKIGIDKSGFILLPIDVLHVFELEKISFNHKDPFDRILVAQAKVEKLVLVTSDKKIWKYNLPLLKA